MAAQSQLKEEIKAKFSKGVAKDEVEKVAEDIAKKLDKKPSIVKALITRYINKLSLIHI